MADPKVSDLTAASDLAGAVLYVVQGGVSKKASADLVMQGSTGSTDNRLLRADGTGAHTLQNSAVTVDDSGNMSGVGTLSAGVTTIASSSSSAPLTVSFSDDGAGSGPIVVYDRVSASPAASDLLGGFYFNGRDSGGNGQSYARVMAAILSPTDGAENGRLRLQTILAGTVADRMLIEGGVYHSSATGGDKGNNTINFGAVYDDNTLLTCMALQSEFLERGEIDLDKWDGMVPDQIVPESREEIPVTVDADFETVVDERAKDGSLVRRKVIAKKRMQVVDFDPVWDEHGNGIDAIAVPVTQEIVTPEQIIKRTHRTARLFKGMIDDGFDPRDPEQYFARMMADEALPGMPTKATWEHNSLSIGEIAGRKWLAMEMLAIVCNVMWGKLRDHEQRIQKLESQYGRSQIRREST